MITRIAFALSALVALSAPVSAQDAETEEVTRREFADWTVLCAADGEQCRMEQTGLTDQGEEAMAMHVVKFAEPQTNDGQTMVAVGSFFVPLGVLLEPGLGLRVDSGEERTAPYLACQPNACVVRVQLDETLVNSFKRGARARFAFVVLQNEQPARVEATVSLSGFTRAYDSLP